MTETTPETAPIPPAPESEPPTEPPAAAPAPAPASEEADGPDLMEPTLESTSQPEPEPESGPGAEPGAEPVRDQRRRLRTVLRWTTAVLVFAVAGGATAYGVTQPQRTRLPGLHTPGDGRWTYPPVALPKLPPGKPRPLVTENPGGIHYVDLRSLLLPAPEGAKADAAFPGTGGWLPSKTYLDAYQWDYSGQVGDEDRALDGDGLRHVAASAWTTPDGTRTEVYLVQFITAGYADLYQTTAGEETVKGTVSPTLDTDATRQGIPKGETVNALVQPPEHRGAVATRYATILAGDTFALVVQTRKDSVPTAPFEQTVRLQAQLLG